MTPPVTQGQEADKDACEGNGSRMGLARYGLGFPNRFAWRRRRALLGGLGGRARRPLSVRYGLCGGMCCAALDYDHAGMMPPQQSEPPAWGTPLHRYLLRRQWDSWQGLRIPLRTLYWMRSSDRRLALQTLEREWPRLRERLDRGEPALLLLVRTSGPDPTLNHQVVAMGYDEDPAGRLHLHVYDPNHPGQNVTLSMNVGLESGGLDAVQSTGEPLRGFLLINYRPRTRGLPGTRPDDRDQKESRAA